MSYEETLIRRLEHFCAASGNKDLEQRLMDLALWFHGNKERIPRDNLAGRQAFLEKALWIFLEICALQTARLQKLEGRSDNLWLPSGVSMNGSAKHFG